MSKKLVIRKKKKLGNTRYGIVLLSITLALTIVGILAALLLHANTLIKQVRDNVELHVYIETNLNESSKNKLEQDFLGVNCKPGELRILGLCRVAEIA